MISGEEQNPLKYLSNLGEIWNGIALFFYLVIPYFKLILNRCDMYLKVVSEVRACKNAFWGVSLLLEVERGYSVFATRYQICGSDKSPLPNGL